MRQGLRPVLLVLVAGFACSSRSSPQTDAVADSVSPDQGTSGLKVAAIQYGPDDQTSIAGCETSTEGWCGVVSLVKAAAAQGAKLIVTPSSAAYLPVTGLLPGVETYPAVGDQPFADARWPADSVMATMAKVADDENIVVVFTVFTVQGSGPGQIYKKTVVAVDATGTVAAVHSVFQLANTELAKKFLTEGTSVDESFFDLSVGKVGILGDADVQRVVTNLSITSDCQEPARDRLREFYQHKPDVVLFATLWGGAEPAIWRAPAVMKKVAESGGTWLVVGNTRNEPYGNGGGVWDPTGSPVAVVQATKATTVTYTLPTP